MFKRTPTGGGDTAPQSYSRSRGQYSRGGGRGGSYNSNRGDKTTTKRGLFADGTWHCDCDPRLPAEHFRVKKDGKNHGRWFYTCQNSANKRCGFFLWDDDAKPREESAVLSNSRTEAGRETEHNEPPQPRPQGQSNAQPSSSSEDFNPTWAAAQCSPPKRKAEVISFDSETEDDDELTSWPATAPPNANAPSTPSKVQKTSALATPSTTRRLPWLDYSAEDAQATTPSRATNAQTSLPTPSLTRLTEDASSPTKGRFKDALAAPAPSSQETLTQDVLAVLQRHGVSLPDSACSELNGLLGRWEMKLQGVTKGRELVRTALRAKEGKVVELQARIAGLEAEREVLRGGLMVDRGGSEEL